MKRALKFVGIGLGALIGLLLLGVVIAGLVIDLDGLVNAQIAQAKPKIEAQLGRQLEVGPVTTSVFPTLGGSVKSVRIAADAAHPEDDQPLLQIGEVRFSVSLWKALLTLGKKVNVNEIAVSDLSVSLVRYKDGTLSYQDILDRQAKAGAEPAPADAPAKPMEPAVQEYLRGLSIDSLRVENARFRLVDYATPTGQRAESVVQKVNLRMNDVRVTEPIRIALDAAIFSDQTNFKLETAVGPLPADLQISGLVPLGKTTLDVNQVDLSKISPYLGKGSLGQVDSAVATMKYEISEVTDARPFEVNGFLEVKKLQLQGGRPFDVRTDTQLTTDLGKGSAQIRKLDLKIGEVGLTASGGFSDLNGAPKFKDFVLRSNNLSPGVLLSYYPAAKKDLPEGFQIDGVAKLDFTASGDAERQQVKGIFDLTPLDIVYPGTLLKPRGVPLALRIDGAVSSVDALLQELALQIDELDLVVRGSVKNFTQPQFDLKASAKPFRFERVARLLPQVAEGLKEKKAKAEGQGKLEGHLKGSMQRLDAALDFALVNVKLNIPGTQLDGDMTLVAKALGDPQKDLKAELKFNANQALIKVNKLMDKGVKTPLALDLALSRTPERLDLNKFDLKLAELGLKVQGGIDYAKDFIDVKVDLDRLDLEKLSNTITALPKNKMKNSFLDFQLAITGDPDQLETVALDVKTLHAKIGRSDLQGTALIKNPLAPDMKLKLTSQNLDLDELFPPKSDAEKAEAKKKKDSKKEEEQPAEDDPELKKYAFDGDFDFKRIWVENTELRNFKGIVKLKDGVLTLEDCTFNVFDGTVTAKGTQAEIWRGKVPFKANLAMKGIDMNQALSSQTKYKNVLEGKADLNLNLAAVGTDTADLEKTLSGMFDLSMKEGRFTKASLLESTTGSMVKPLSAVPGMQVKSMGGSNAIRDLAAAFEVMEGKMKLKKPVGFNLDGNRAQLDGAIGIVGKLFLTGTYFLPGTVLSGLTGGKCSAAGELPIPIAIEGTVDSPSYRPDVSGVMKGAMDQCLKGAAAAAAQQKLDDAKRKAEEKVNRRKAEAEASARAEAERRRQEAEAAANKAKADAEARARAEAEKKKKAAEEAAKNKLKGLKF